MKKRFWTLALVIMGMFLIFISGCKKADNNNNLTPTSFKKIKNITYSDGGITTIEYNSNGKASIIKGDLTSDGPGHTYTSTYFYSGNTITESVLYQPGGGIENTIYNLNGNGFVSKSTRYSGSYIDEVINFEYDNAGYCTREYDDIPSSEYCTYTYTNGNLTSVLQVSSGRSYVTTYEYYLDKENTLSHENMGLSFEGKSSKNLVKKETTGTNTIYYSYEFDQDNYVTKQTRTDGSSVTWCTISYIQ